MEEITSTEAGIGVAMVLAKTSLKECLLWQSVLLRVKITLSYGLCIVLGDLLLTEVISVCKKTQRTVYYRFFYYLFCYFDLQP